MNIREIKRKSREDLNNSVFGDNWLYAVLFVFVISAIEAGVTATLIGAIVTVIIAGPFVYSMSKAFLLVSRKQEERVKCSRLFDGFQDNFSRNLLTNLLIGLFEALWTLLFFIPGLIKSYSYAMTMYILIDDDKIGCNDAITKSREMMNGHKWDLFVLDLSFIGWYLLGCLCLGVGVFFVVPYHEMARANFYEELRNAPVDVKSI